MIEPTNHTIVFLRTVLAARIGHARRSQRGASAVEWVLISALLIGIAIAVGAIILAKLTGKANDLDLG
jgi:Flp pilus assembly protein TadG